MSDFSRTVVGGILSVAFAGSVHATEVKIPEHSGSEGVDALYGSYTQAYKKIGEVAGEIKQARQTVENRDSPKDKVDAVCFRVNSGAITGQSVGLANREFQKESQAYNMAALKDAQSITGNGLPGLLNQLNEDRLSAMKQTQGAVPDFQAVQQFCMGRNP
jgi:hypothetical protein